MELRMSIRFHDQNLRRKNVSSFIFSDLDSALYEPFESGKNVECIQLKIFLIYTKKKHSIYKSETLLIQDNVHIFIFNIQALSEKIPAALLTIFRLFG